ncbi:thioredoxin [Lactiplantibacillus plantarum]|nr:thioredoxin [Lactiplantibacillus plantarum]
MVAATTDKTFTTDTASGVTLTDFWATWCGPCRMQSPVVEQLADEMGDKVTFNKMDVDANPETAGYPSVTIVHGKGTGALREGITNYLKSNRQVKSFHFAAPNHGGNGATEVQFK